VYITKDQLREFLRKLGLNCDILWRWHV